MATPQQRSGQTFMSTPEQGPLIANLRARVTQLQNYDVNAQNSTAALGPEHFAARSKLQHGVAEAVGELKDAGMDDEAILGLIQDAENPLLQPGATRPGSCPPPPAPTSGEESWGRWSHSPSTISLELLLDDGTEVSQLSVETAEGWLLAGVDAGDDSPPPLLFGRLAQPCDAGSLELAVDTDGSDRRVLCIELTKQQRIAGGSATVDCCFDESLHIRGEACLLPGLSQGTITIDLPDGLKM